MKDSRKAFLRISIVYITLVYILTGCASFQVSTLNHDPIYSIESSDAEVISIA